MHTAQGSGAELRACSGRRDAPVQAWRPAQNWPSGGEGAGDVAASSRRRDARPGRTCSSRRGGGVARLDHHNLPPGSPRALTPGEHLLVMRGGPKIHVPAEYPQATTARSGAETDQPAAQRRAARMQSAAARIAQACGVQLIPWCLCGGLAPACAAPVLCCVTLASSPRPRPGTHNRCAPHPAGLLPPGPARTAPARESPAAPLPCSGPPCPPAARTQRALLEVASAAPGWGLSELAGPAPGLPMAPSLLPAQPQQRLAGMPGAQPAGGSRAPAVQTGRKSSAGAATASASSSPPAAGTAGAKVSPGPEQAAGGAPACSAPAAGAARTAARSRPPAPTTRLPAAHPPAIPV